MNRLLRWTFLLSVTCIMKDAHSQYGVPYEGNRYQPTPEELYCDSLKDMYPTSAKNQMMNTLLSVAATKGVLPELTSALQPVLGEPFFTPQEIYPNMATSLIPNTYPGQTSQNSIDYSQLYLPPTITSSAMENHVFTPEFIPNYQPLQTQEFHDYYKYLTDIPTSQDDTAVNFKTGYFPTVDTKDMREKSRETAVDSSIYKQPAIVTCDSEYIPPFNIEINVPLPQLSEELLILLSDQSVSKNVNSIPNALDAPLPIIISKGKSRSSLKKVLPILLLAMLLDDNDCCGCSGRCDCDANFIPIPYPIPVPVNNPIICLDKSKYNSGESESHEDE